MKFLLLFVIAFNALSLYSAEIEKDYYMHSIVKQTMNDENQSAIDLWIDFLYEPNDTIRRGYWEAADIEKYGDDYCLFQNGYFQFDRITQLQYFVPFILSVEKRNKSFTIRTMFTQKQVTLSDTAVKNQLPTAIIKVKVVNENNTLRLTNVIDDEVKKWNSYKTKNINYIVNNDIAIDTAECKKAQEFLDTLSTMWGKNLETTLDYFVSNSSESINRLVGNDFAFYGGIGNGVAGRNGSYLLVGNEDYNYKHELVHIVMNNAGNRLLSEGIATYLGGRNEQEYEQVKSNFFDKYYPLDKAKIEKISEYPRQMDYYVLGAVLCELIMKEKGIAGIKEIWDTQGSSNMSNGLEDYNTLKNRIVELTGKSESEFIKYINAFMSSR